MKNAIMTFFSGLVLAAAFAAGASAASLEAGGDIWNYEYREPLPGPIRPIPPPAPEPWRRPEPRVVTDFIRRVAVENPVRYGNVYIFPLVVARSDGGSGIKTLEQARSQGLLQIYEKSHAAVDELHAKNDSSRPVLLMAGEILSGGRQNRMVRADTLLPAYSDWVSVPVYCAEKGRWAGDERKTFSGTGAIAAPGLRAGAASGHSQNMVWAEIERQAGEADAVSPTRDYSAIYEKPGVRSRLDEYARNLRKPSRGGIIGLAAVSGGVILGCDIFSDPELLAAQWDNLVRSYCLESRDYGIWRGRVSAGEIQELLNLALAAHFIARRTDGEGILMDIAGDVRGSALIWNERLVHAGIFPRYPLRREPPAPEPYKPHWDEPYKPRRPEPPKPIELPAPEPYKPWNPEPHRPHVPEPYEP